MRLRQIEVFHAIYTTGSVTAAAEKLCVSQPSISKVLKHTEQQLGFELFIRLKGRLTPTKEAELLFHDVERIYQQLSNIKNVTANIRNNAIGTVRVAVTPALGFDVLPKSCVLFGKTYPKIRYNIATLHTAQLLNHLDSQLSEVAIMFNPPKLAGIRQQHLAMGKLVAIYPKEIEKTLSKPVTLTTLFKQPYISISNSGPLADVVDNEFNNMGVSPLSFIQVQTYFIAVNLVKNGAGFCIVDEFTAKGQDSSKIAIIELPINFSFEINALYLANVPISKVASKFIDLLKSLIHQ